MTPNEQARPNAEQHTSYQPVTGRARDALAAIIARAEQRLAEPAQPATLPTTAPPSEWRVAA